MTRDPITTTGSPPESGAWRRAACPPDPPGARPLWWRGWRRSAGGSTGSRRWRSSAAASGESPEPDRALRQKVAELEEKLGRAQAEARRRDQEWKAAIEQLEGDRKLLAEAWERLERERVDAAGAPPAAPRPYAPRPAPVPPAPAAARPAATTEADDAVAHAVLKQFQALRGDVRRNGTGRRPRG